ncbi:MAG TPA: Jag N-terminal domain-containing protein, partial [Acidimicrobiia bacterium]|nr:Jag N-terminal domain-containing protein [Acidimicrobiia bacterium]
MEWIVTTGKTVTEAVEAALDELGVDEADIEYEVIAEPKRGFLGFGTGTPARIKARVKPLSREKPDRRRRGGGRDRERRSGGEGGDRPARGRSDRSAGDRSGGDRSEAGDRGGRERGGERPDRSGARAGSDRSGGGRAPRNRPSARPP